VEFEPIEAREISEITAEEVKFFRKTAKHELFEHKKE